MESIKKLKDYREASGLTQDELAHLSDISIRTIQRIEAGESGGSAYTLKKLAEALEINNWKLLLEDDNSVKQIDNIRTVKRMNLSSLAILILPLSNFIFPLLIFIKEKEKKSEQAYKILSFQLLWLLITIALMFLLPFLGFLFFESLRGIKIPLYVLIYFLSVVVNIVLILLTAIQLNKGRDILTFVPKIF